MRIALGLLLLAGVAHADSATQEARAHFRAGSQAFDLGRYDEAAKEFEAAFRAKEDPSFLFNLAQAFRLNGRDVDAVRVYRSFLHHVPDSPQRVEVEKRIAALEKAIEERRRAKDGPPEGTLTPALTSGTPSVERSPSDATPAVETVGSGALSRWYQDPIAMPLASIGVAAVATGVGLVVFGAITQGQADASTDLQKRSDLHDRATKFSLAGYVTGGAGLALGVGAALKWAIWPKRPPSQVSINVDAAPGWVFANLQRSF